MISLLINIRFVFGVKFVNLMLLDKVVNDCISKEQCKC